MHTNKLYSNLVQKIYNSINWMVEEVFADFADLYRYSLNISHTIFVLYIKVFI